MKPEHFQALYREISHFDRHLGLDLEIIEPGRICYELTVAEQHLSASGACHGGVLSGMMDAVLGVTALSWAVTRGMLCATVEFKINYLSSVEKGTRLRGSGQLDFTGSRLVVTSATIVDASDGRSVVKGMGTFNLYPLSKRTHLSSLLSLQPAPDEDQS